MPIELLPMSMRHLDSFRSCVGTVAREGRHLAFTEPFSLAETALYVARLLEAGHPMFVVLDDDAVVGWCDVTPKPGSVYRHVGVLGMGLLRPYRGRGLGTRLIAATLAAARRKWEQVELTVYATNTNAQALYRKVGFVERGRLPLGRKVGDRYDDVIVMSLLFER